MNLKHASSDIARVTRTDLSNNKYTFQEYFTISEGNKNRMDFITKKKNSDEYQSFMKKKIQRWPELNILQKRKPETTPL